MLLYILYVAIHYMLSYICDYYVKENYEDGFMAYPCMLVNYIILIFHFEKSDYIMKAITFSWRNFTMLSNQNPFPSKEYPIFCLILT